MIQHRIFTFRKIMADRSKYSEALKIIPNRMDLEKNCLEGDDRA